MRTVSQLFAAGVALRNGLYDRGVLKTRRLARPVISVGNISVGGSGKTPFVIALGELLKHRGIAFDVLSRGYGRKSSATAVVDPAGRPEQVGDEPLLIARKLDVPVIVGRERYDAGTLAEKEFNSKLHLLDDGFQHRVLHRDFDIVMLPSSDLHDSLLPLGRLREPITSLARADAVVVSDDIDESLVSKWMRDPKNLWRARRVQEVDTPPGKALAFCGIARAEQFFAQLRDPKVQLVATRSFSDHHRYSERNIAMLLKEKSASGADFFITTEKDVVNLGPYAGRLQPLYVTSLRMILDDEQVMRSIRETLERRCGCRL